LRLCISSSLTLIPFGPGVELAPHLQAGLGFGGRDQFDHCQTAGQRRAPPILGDVAEQPVLNLVPLRGPGRIMQTRSVKPVSSDSFWSSTLNSRAREPLEPPPSAVIIRRCMFGYRSRPMTASQPAADRVDRELRRIVVDAAAFFKGGKIRTRGGTWKDWEFLYNTYSRISRNLKVFRSGAIRVGGYGPGAL
jgi:hypothetical protein